MVLIPSSYGRFVTHCHGVDATGHPHSGIRSAIDTTFFLIHNANLPPEVVSALDLLYTILQSGAAMDRNKRIKAISEIYSIVFFLHNRIWSERTFVLVYSLFKFVGHSPMNRRSLWVKWEDELTAADFLYLEDRRPPMIDAPYNMAMTEIMDSIAEAGRDEIYDTHHPCEYESAMGIQGDDAMDFVVPDHVGIEQTNVLLIGE